MRALIYREFGGPITLETVADPVCTEESVVVRVRANGLCRSDWHGWMGHDPDIRLPHVPGHELAGEIVEVGSGVRRHRAGDRVTVPFVCGCGHCAECASGNQQVCENQSQPGFTHWGSFAEYVRLDYADVNLVALPDEIDYVTAASLGCRFVTSFRAIADQGRVGPGEWVAVHGCGGVGLSAIMIARALGARVIAVDISAEKLARAREAGAEVCVNAGAGLPVEGAGLPPATVNLPPATVNLPPGGDVAGAIRELTGGGAHLSMDALGSPATCFHSVSCLRTRGRHVQVGLTLAEQSTPPIPMDRVVARELTIIGSHGIQAHRYPEIFAMIQAGTLRPQDLVSARISLEEAAGELMRMGSFPQVGISVVDRF